MLNNFQTTLGDFQDPRMRYEILYKISYALLNTFYNKLWFLGVRLRYTKYLKYFVYRRRTSKNQSF